MVERDGHADRFATVSTRATWLLFALSVAVVVATTRFGHDLSVGGLVRVDGLTTVMWVVVTFFSGVVQSFSRRYMAANRDVTRFFARILVFTGAVLVVTAADHVLLFVLAWAVMGLAMASLIGHVDEWPQARAAGRLARRYFLGASALLAAGLSLLAFHAGTATISDVVASTDALSTPVLVAAAGLLLAAAMIQSALFPFHRWLLSSMTAPTPASAMMHAGFVNAGGVLLSRFSPVFAWDATVLVAVVVVGAVSSLLAQAWMLVQPDTKGRLGCSTVAQMGFMILQCGLGFFAAAVTHLIVHGFYKAYLFLSTGSRIEKKPPKSGRPSGRRSTLLRIGVGSLTAVGGGLLFAALTGKGVDPSHTGVFLVVIVVVSVFQGTSELFERASLSPLVRTAGTALLAVPSIGLYALAYNAVSELMHGLPLIEPSVEMTAVHWFVLGLFVLGHLAGELGWLEDNDRLYVLLLNASQSDPRTVATQTGEYRN